MDEIIVSILEMGIPNLDKNLSDFITSGNINDESILQYVNETEVCIDLSSLIHKYANTSNDSEQYKKFIESYFKNLESVYDKILVYVDEGDIEEKREIREKRKDEFNYRKKSTIEKTLESISDKNIPLKTRRELSKHLEHTNIIEYEDHINKFETCKRELEKQIESISSDLLDLNIENKIQKIKKNIFAVGSLSNKKEITNLTIEIIKNIKNLEIIKCENIDAEYILTQKAIENYKKYKKIPYIIAIDQDVTFLMAINGDYKYFAIDNKIFENNQVVKNICWLTIIFNGYDYNKGGIKDLAINITFMKVGDKQRLYNILNNDFELIDLVSCYILNFKKINKNSLKFTKNDINEIEKKFNAIIENIKNYASYKEFKAITDKLDRIELFAYVISYNRSKGVTTEEANKIRENIKDKSYLERNNIIIRNGKIYKPDNKNIYKFICYEKDLNKCKEEDPLIYMST